MGHGNSGHLYKTYGGKRYWINTSTEHSVLKTGEPNSVTQTIDGNGNVIKERYFDSDGKALVDIDYTDHGNPATHRKVPHKHTWDWSNPNKPKRSKKDD